MHSSMDSSDRVSRVGAQYRTGGTSAFDERKLEMDMKQDRYGESGIQVGARREERRDARSEHHQLAGRSQERHVISDEEARRELNDFFDNLGVDSRVRPMWLYLSDFS